MVYNTNIRNFYLKMKETSICKKSYSFIRIKLFNQIDLNAGASDAVRYLGAVS